MNIKGKQNRFLAKTVKADSSDNTKGRQGFDELFSKSWEVFVIKKDRTTKKMVGKTACCATACV